jgi:ribosomal protein L7/L12
MVDDVKDGKPQLVKKDVSRAEAEDIRRKFEAAGAQIRVS